ncbi:formate dehydrogenase subunit delta [Gemmatimonas sp.]|uniref:formate dehydrogenase subunit delta n=1 Tax=Gemmatimonas sp. TaxID=1962908 RepID=UPI00286E20A0|nr:formate dehydrogenase subunit delta [Gemmatimonas sp.]
MEAETLVRMANQIAHFFAPYPETDAIEGVRDHLVHFWDPAMRKELLAIASGLTPASTPIDALVLRAVRQLRQGVDE